jgi:hypothetical protein
MRARLQPTTGFAQMHGSALRSPVQLAERPSDPRSAASGFHDRKAGPAATEGHFLFENVMIEPLPGVPVNQMVTDK